MSEQKSKSRRTTVTVEVEDDGSGVVIIDRDGLRVHRFDIPKEPVQKAGLGN